jgi:protein SCO1/2
MTALRVVRYGVWAAVVVLGAIIVGLVVWQRAPESGVAAATLGGPFSLNDQHGATVTEAALQGHPSAMFFGYTNCPDVCPTTLYDMTTWLKELGPGADKLKVYFVTVDPERDTTDQLAAYLQPFDPRIVALTGSRAAVDQMLKDYRVYSRKVPLDDGGYSMDHTAAVYLLDSTGHFTGTVDYKEDPAVVMQKLKRLVGIS